MARKNRPDPAAQCPLCGLPRRWLRLEVGVSQVAYRRVWRLASTDDPSLHLVAPGFDKRTITDLTRYDICRSGHVLVSPTAPVWVDNVIRVLGTVAAGKSYLMQALEQQSSLPAPRDSTFKLSWPDSLAGQKHKTTSPIPATRDNTETCRDRLLRTLRVGDDPLDLSPFLRDLGLSEEDILRWGTEAPPLLIASRSATATHQSAICDLPGELVDKILANLPTEHDVAQLPHSDAILWVVEAFIAQRLHHVLRRHPLLSGSVRKESGQQVDLAKLRETAQTNSTSFAQHLSRTDNSVMAGGMAELLVALTKTDLVREFLTEGGGDWWAGIEGPARARLRRRWVDAGAHALVSYAARLDRLDPDARTRSLLTLIGDDWDDPATRARASHIAAGILDHFADPDEFWNLVFWGEEARVVVSALPDNDDFAQPLVLPLDPIDTYSRQRFRRVTLQPRDLMTTVLVRGFLSESIDEGTMRAVERDRVVRYFLTYAPLGRKAHYTPEKATFDLESGQTSVAGDLHLLSWVMAKVVLQ